MQSANKRNKHLFGQNNKENNKVGFFSHEILPKD